MSVAEEGRSDGDNNKRDRERVVLTVIDRFATPNRVNSIHWVQSKQPKQPKISARTRQRRSVQTEIHSFAQRIIRTAQNEQTDRQTGRQTATKKRVF